MAANRFLDADNGSPRDIPLDLPDRPQLEGPPHAAAAVVKARDLQNEAQTPLAPVPVQPKRVQGLLYQYNPWWERRDSLADVGPRSRYVGLDDYVLRPNSILDVVITFRHIHKLSVDDPVFRLPDEITAKDDFHQQLKTLIDRGGVAVIAATSSISLLKDQQALLTGRSATVEVQPPAFEEYLRFRGIEIPRRDHHLPDTCVRDYVRTGGLPEHVLPPSRDYLMNLVDDIIQKDITAFHGVRDSMA